MANVRGSFEHPLALHGPRVDWPALRRILVVRPDNLGDVVMSGPAVAALAAAAPRASVDVLAAPAGAAAAAMLPHVEDVLVASVSWQQGGGDPVPVEQDLELVGRIRERGYDAAVVLTSFSQSPWPAAALCRLAGVPVRIGTSKEFGGAALTHWVPAPADDLHQVDRMLHVLARVGVPPVGSRLRVEVPAGATARADDVLAEHGLPRGVGVVAVLPGASCSARRYPADRYAEVVRLLAAAGSVPVVIGTANERGLVAEVAAGHGSAVAVAGALDVPALAAALARSSVVLTNNSGGMHLADAVGTPQVVLFSGTEEASQYAPRFTTDGSAATVLTVEVACSPCRQFRCPYALECLDVGPQQVADEVCRRGLRAMPTR